VIHTAGRPYLVHTLRSLPGEDLRTTLAQWCDENGIEAAAVVSAVGSLSTAMLRFGGKRESTRIDGDLEVCSLSGTLSRHGMHLHLSVADRDGHMTGGHASNGCIVRTTLEIVVQEIGGVRYLRKHDERTGYDELFAEPITP
jgi:predicted DNA-binding protein with PD1-like motif